MNPGIKFEPPEGLGGKEEFEKWLDECARILEKHIDLEAILRCQAELACSGSAKIIIKGLKD